MISCQRHLFSIPEEVTYLNCAFTAPLLDSAQAAGRSALQAKQAPWTIAAQDFFDTTEAVRKLFAALINCPADHVAIIPAVSYGIALVAKNIAVGEGERIVLLEDQFPSNVYSWQQVAAAQNAIINTVQRPVNNDWTAAVLGTIDDSTAVVAVPNCHWTDGTLLDLVRIGQKCRAVSAALVVDGSQSLGAMPLAVDTVQPDFLVTTAHKWLLGPYSYGFCYVAPRWQHGEPLEENWMNRAGSEDLSRLVDYQKNYRPGARRFDVGEVSNFILAPIARAALQQLLQWGVEEISVSLQAITAAIAERAGRLGLRICPANLRSPHLIGLTLRDGKAKELAAQLAAENILVSVRGNSIRISPHLYNTHADIDRLFSVLEASLR